MLPVTKARADSAGTAGSALALAALVTPYSPTITTGDKRVIETLFDGNPNAAYPAGKRSPLRPTRSFAGPVMSTSPFIPAN
jgi:hypothetical protein